MNPFRKRTPPPQAPKVIVIGAEDFMRRFLLDTGLNEAGHMQALLGIPELDADEEAEELAESLARRKRVYARFGNLIASVSHHYGLAITQLSHMYDATADEEMTAHAHEVLEQALATGFMALLCQLDDIGLINQP